jgi:elongation factor G
MENDFVGVIDLIQMKGILWEDTTLGAEFREVPIPKEMEEHARHHRELLMETLSDKNEQIMEKYLSEEEIDLQEIREAIRKTTINLELVPIFCGAALRNKGIQPLLDGIVDFLPSPVDIPPIVGHEPSSGNEEIRTAEFSGPFAALAFKVKMDQGRKMTYLRIYSGTAKTGALVYNPSKDVKEKLSRLLKMHSNKRERIDKASAGDIVAAMGLKLTTTGDTLCTEDAPILLEAIQFNEPVITMAIEPRKVQDNDKLFESLEKVSDEDPTFKYKIDDDTGQTVISGMGELHLEIIVGRLKREFGVDTNQGNPQVVYRETILRPVAHEEIFQRELAGVQHYAGLKIEVSPRQRSSGNQFRDHCENPELNEEMLAGIQEGILEAETSGPIMGYPVIDVQTTLLDAQIKETSDALSFKIAATMAFKNACQKAEAVLLEPIMNAEVLVPDEFTGEVISDLNSRQGKIEQIVAKGPIQVITASVPLSKMFGYSTALRSLSQGRGTFSMQFSYYDKT